jgi:hypothetical protein
MDDQTTTCPKCGHPNEPSAVDCSRCGITFSVFNKEREHREAQSATEKKPPGGSISPPSGEKPLELQQRFPCPNCGHENDLADEECVKCGVVFSKYFTLREEDFADDPKMRETIRIQKEDNLKAVAARKQKEEKEKADARQREALERKKAKELRKQRAALEEAEKERLGKLEQEKAEVLKKQKDASNKKVSMIKERVRKETSEALQKQREEITKKLELIKERAHRETTEALKKQEEEYEKKLAKFRDQAEQEKERALKAQQEEFKEAENAQKTAAEKEKAEALLQQEESFKTAQKLKKEQYEKQRSEALKWQKEDLERNARSETFQVITEMLDPRPSFQELLKKYVGQTVGIDYDGPAEMKPVILAGVQEDYLSVLAIDNEQFYNYPFRNILSVSEGISGVGSKSSDESTVFSAVIKLINPVR